MIDTGVLIAGIAVVALMVAVIIALRIRFRNWVRSQKELGERNVYDHGTGQLIDSNVCGTIFDTSAHNQGSGNVLL